MENNKRNGIFLGVVAVATLIVAIIGATFAYFSATVTAENTVDLTAYNFDMTANVELVSPTTDFGGLIPLDPTTKVGNTENLLYAVNTGANKGSENATKCVDSNGHQVCALYKLTVTNNGTQKETLGVSIKSLINSAYSEELKDNLKVQMLDGTLGSLSKMGSEKILPEENGTVALDSTTNISVDPKVGETATTKDVYFVVYLDDTGVTVDQSKQMGSTYSGQVILSSGTGNKLTGTFNVAG